LHGEVATTSPATTTHNHSNQQYSITAVTTSAGAIAERYAYSAYGEPTILDSSGNVITSSSINNRYSYTGREWDSTVGLHHFRARWMSPKTGRFLGRDPIGYAGSPYCLYESLDSRPFHTTDPTGMSIGFACDVAWTAYSIYPCAKFLQIFNEFRDDCDEELDEDYLEFMDKYTSATRGGRYCGCMGALCPETQIYKEDYANICCVLVKVRKAEIRYGEPDSLKFRRSISSCIEGLIGIAAPR